MLIHVLVVALSLYSCASFLKRRHTSPYLPNFLTYSKFYLTPYLHHFLLVRLARAARLKLFTFPKNYYTEHASESRFSARRFHPFPHRSPSVFKKILQRRGASRPKNIGIFLPSNAIIGFGFILFTFELRQCFRWRRERGERERGPKKITSTFFCIFPHASEVVRRGDSPVTSPLV